MEIGEINTNPQITVLQDSKVAATKGHTSDLNEGCTRVRTEKRSQDLGQRGGARR